MAPGPAARYVARPAAAAESPSMAAYPAVAVIGLGTFGAAVATDLADYGHHVIGVDLELRPRQRPGRPAWRRR